MGPLQSAIDDALAASSDFVGLVADRVYSFGTVPKEPVAPYVELGDSAERAGAAAFMQGGNVSEETLTIVTPRRDGKPGVAAVLAAMTDALDGVALDVDGHTVLAARLELVTVFPDPDVTNLRGVCRLTVSSWTL